MNLDTDDPVGARNRAILFGLVTMVVIGVVLGLTVGILSSRAVDSTGIDDVKAPKNLPGPSNGPYGDFTAGPTPTEDTFEPTEPTTPSESSEPTPTKPTKKHDRNEPTLNASPETASGSEQVTLTGRFPGLGAGVSVAVERKEGGSWADFAGVTMTTEHGGHFSTWIWTGQSGANLFRVTAESGESTPPVTVHIM